MARAALALALFALALVPAAAGADSLVYVKGGNVWISHSDGSAARQVTTAPNNWAWPSTADDGTVFAAGGAQRVNLDGSDSDGSTEIYRLDQSGRQIGPFLETPGSRSTPQCPTYAPDSLRVSPNGQQLSYNLFFCNNRDSFLQPVGGAFSLISEDYAADMWLDDGHILITHIGSTIGNAAYAVYDVATKDGHGPTDDPYLPERQAVASRSGNRVAVYEDDFDLSGNITQADIRLYATAGNDVTQPTQKCTIAIAPAAASKFLFASPTFTPDGTRLAWAEADGIHSANTSNLDNCASVADSLLVPGGAEPFFGAANESNVVPPPPPPPPHHSFAVRSSTKRAKLSSSGALSFVVTAAESGSGTATGTISVPKSAKTIRFASRRISLVAGKPVKITLKLSKKNAKLVRRALRHRKLTAKVTLTAKAPSGDSTTQKLAIRLKR